MNVILKALARGTIFVTVAVGVSLSVMFLSSLCQYIARSFDLDAVECLICFSLVFVFILGAHDGVKKL